MLKTKDKKNCMSILIYLLIVCVCGMRVAASWTPVWTETPSTDAQFAAFDPFAPNLMVVYVYYSRYAINVTTGTVLWSTNDNATQTAAVRGSELFVIHTINAYTSALSAYDALTGQLQWAGPQFDNFTDFRAPPGTELVILTTINTIYAINGTNGETVWSQLIPNGIYLLFDVWGGVVSVCTDPMIYGLDLKNGDWLWQVNNEILTIPIFLNPPMSMVITYRGPMSYFNAFDVTTGVMTEWAALNHSYCALWAHYDVSNKMIVVKMYDDHSEMTSLIVFDSTSGTLVAMLHDVWQYTGHQNGCIADLCIFYNSTVGQLIAMNYMTGSVAWSVTEQIFAGRLNSMTYMRPNLILITCGDLFGNGVVLGIDPTSGKYWKQSVGSFEAYVLQQRGSSQVLVGANKALVLANV